MSLWTHITATLSVDTFIHGTREEVETEIEKVLKSAPEIEGSEGPAEINYFIKSGYNWSRFGPDGKSNGQSRAVITIQGDLRDCIANETIAELEIFIVHIISRGIDIRDGSYAVSGVGGEMGFINDSGIYQRRELEE